MSSYICRDGTKKSEIRDNLYQRGFRVSDSKVKGQVQHDLRTCDSLADGYHRANISQREAKIRAYRPDVVMKHRGFRKAQMI